MNGPTIHGAVRTVFSLSRVSQAGVLYAAVLSSIVIGFVTSVLTTRYLGPQGYGDMKFITNAFQVMAIVSTLGIFTTGSQLLARDGGNDARRKSLLGSLLFFAFLLSAGGMILSFLLSYAEGVVFGHGLGPYFIFFAPLAAILIVQPCLENILQGENKIHALSLLRVLPGLLYVLFLLAGAFVTTLTLEAILLLQMITGAAVVYAGIRYLRPSFRNIRQNLAMVWSSNGQYGWHVYLGVLAGVATTYLSTFMISYHLDNIQVGYFSLAMTLTLPLVQVASVVGTTYFRDFANSGSLPARVTMVTASIAGAAYLGFLLLIRPLVAVAYTEDFSRVASLAGVVGLGAMLHGMGDYFNRFLGAHRRGKELRNGALAVGAVNVAGYTMLVDLYGLEGAAGTRVLGGAVYCGMMILYYRRYVTDRQQPRGTAQTPVSVHTLDRGVPVHPE